MSMDPKVSIIIPAYNVSTCICKSLDEVRRQTLQNFECIVVNDGSKDNTADIVEDYIRQKKDYRFRLINQDNKGPGGARNKGIEAAKGKYIVFYDADDAYPVNALTQLVSVADKRHADLVIGRMWITSLNERHEEPALLRLTNYERIYQFDEDIIKTASPCNKLFVRKIIMNNNIRFSGLKRSEGLLFCLQYEGKCNLIAPCKGIVYEYKRRPFWEEGSFMQNNEMSSYESLIEAERRCLNTLEDNYKEFKSKIDQSNTIALAELKNSYEKLVSKLYCEYVRSHFFEEFYSYLWTTESKILDSVANKITEYKKHIYPFDWETEMSQLNQDLVLAYEGFASKSEIATKPKITFAVSEIDDKKKLNLTIKGLYSQDFPLFEIILQKSLREKLDAEWKKMDNVRFINSDGVDFKDAAFKNCRGKYIWFIDKPIYLSKSLVRDLYGHAEKEDECLFTSIPMVTKMENDYRRIDANAASFINEYANQKMRTAYNQLDFFWVNKLFTISKLRKMKNPFNQADWETFDRFYRNSLYNKTDKLSLVTELKQEDILNRVTSIWVKLNWRRKLEKEEKFLCSFRNREERIFTYAERWRWARRYGKRLAFRWATIKVIYPIIYTIYKLKPIDDKKVLFVELVQTKPTNSMERVIETVKKVGTYNVQFMSLMHNDLRRKDLFKPEIKFIKEMATARYLFIAESIQITGGFTKRKGTTTVQLWHGCGAFKRFGLSTADLLFGDDRKTQEKYPNYRNIDLVTVSSPEVIWAYEEAMGHEDDNIVKATGVSRTDKFYDIEYIEEAKQRVLGSIPQAQGKKILLYAPTFRGRRSKGEAPDQLDIEAMKKALCDDCFLLIKHHPYVRTLPPIPRDCQDFAKDVTNENTIDDLICCADVCISDYSSLVFEYSLFEKPMLFYAYDLDEYNDWRGFYYDYEDLTPGPIVYNTDDIIDYIRNIDTKFDVEEVRSFRNKFMSACDGHSTERILREIDMI